MLVQQALAVLFSSGLALVAVEHLAGSWLLQVLPRQLAKEAQSRWLLKA